MAIQHSYTLSPANASLTGFLSNATGATWTLTATAPTDGLAHQVSIKGDAATNHSAKTALLTGTDADGRPQTETINLPNGTATVESTKYFKTLTSVVPSATIGADTMDIGWVDEVASPTIMLNHWSTEGALIQAVLTGTINYTVQVTAMRRELFGASQELIDWSSTTTTALVGATTSLAAELEPSVIAARVLINSYTDGATLKVHVSETGLMR